MKCIISFLAVCLVLLCAFPCSAQAASGTDVDTEYLSDGGYIVTELANPNTRDAAQTKVKTYYNSDDVIEWKIILTGTFRYNGTVATCTGATCDVEIYDSSWYVVSKTAYCELATATCEVTMGKNVAGVNVVTPSFELSITCIRYGVYV